MWLQAQNHKLNLRWRLGTLTILIIGVSLLLLLFHHLYGTLFNIEEEKRIGKHKETGEENEKIATERDQEDELIQLVESSSVPVPLDEQDYTMDGSVFNSSNEKINEWSVTGILPFLNETTTAMAGDYSNDDFMDAEPRNILYDPISTSSYSNFKNLNVSDDESEELYSNSSQLVELDSLMEGQHSTITSFSNESFGSYVKSSKSFFDMSSAQSDPSIDFQQKFETTIPNGHNAENFELSDKSMQNSNEHEWIEEYSPTVPPLISQTHESRINLSDIEQRNQSDTSMESSIFTKKVIRSTSTSPRTFFSRITIPVTQPNPDYRKNLRVTFVQSVFRVEKKPRITTKSSKTKTKQMQQHRHRHHHRTYSSKSPVIVTALFDIGRSMWKKYTRTYEQYLSYLKSLLQLKNRLVVFTDKKGAEFVYKWRHVSNTQIIETSLDRLPFYQFLQEIQFIIDNEQSDWKYDAKVKDQPEAKSAIYNILVNSKPYFLYNATVSCKFRFNADYYAWIDAGYGHSEQGVIPLNCYWEPYIDSTKITIIKITPKHDKIHRYSLSDLYRVDWTVISGGFIGGGAQIINRFYRFYYKVFIDLLDSRRIDDDQINDRVNGAEASVAHHT